MRYFFLIIITFISVVILWINIKLHTENYTKTEQTQDVLLQLNFLEKELKNDNLGERMQRIFPEGYVFVNALYGLAWCELAIADSLKDSRLKERAIEEALYAFDEINSDRAKWTFENALNPEYGIFYCGWKNYLLSKILAIDTTFSSHEVRINQFKSQSDSILKALRASESPYLESYSRQSWPADMFVAMASINNHDKIFKPKYKIEIDAWIQKVKSRLDPVTNMIPHKVDSKTGKSIQGTRGSSMGLMLRMLCEIDPVFGKEQFKLYKTNFISTTFGLPSVREYPIGQDGIGDIDSGPVIFGVGFSSTIVSIGTLSMYSNQRLANYQYKTVNAFGFDIKARNQKWYLLGKLPMADAFIAWGRASDLSCGKEPIENSQGWTFKFHLVSMFLLLVFWTLFYGKQIVRKIEH